MRREEIVVAGAGPAGCAAAVQCARLGVAPLVLDSAGRAGGLVRNAFLVENYPGPRAPISGRELAARFASHLERFDIGVEAATVVGVNADGGRWRVETDRGDIDAACAIIATGTVARVAGIDGEEALADRRLFYQATDLLERAPSPARVAVIGGGEAAFDYALSCAAAGAKVDLLIRGPAPRANPRLLAMVAASPRVFVHLRARVSALAATEAGAAVSVGEAGGETSIEVDAVLVAVGREPAAPARGLTGARGLTIIGDARLGGLGQVGIAVGDGLEAAREMVAALERGSTR